MKIEELNIYADKKSCVIDHFETIYDDELYFCKSESEIHSLIRNCKYIIKDAEELLKIIAFCEVEE